MLGDLGDNSAVSKSRTAVRTAIVAGLIFATAGALTGCLSQAPGGDVTPTATAPAESPTPSTTASPTPTPTPEKPTPVAIACSDVVDAQTIYDFNPNFVLLNSFSPASNTLAAQAIQDQGTACRWINQTSKITIDIGISSPGPNALSVAERSASAGASVSGLGDSAYFSRSGGLGTVQVFSGEFWISAASPAFSAAEDAMALVEHAVASTR